MTRPCDKDVPVRSSALTELGRPSPGLASCSPPHPMFVSKGSSPPSFAVIRHRSGRFALFLAAVALDVAACNAKVQPGGAAGAGGGGGAGQGGRSGGGQGGGGVGSGGAGGVPAADGGGSGTST